MLIVTSVGSFPVLFNHIDSYAVESLGLPWNGFIDTRADEPIYLYGDEATYERYAGNTARLPRRRLIDLILEFTADDDVSMGGTEEDGVGGADGDAAGGDKDGKEDAEEAADAVKKLAAAKRQAEEDKKNQLLRDGKGLQEMAVHEKLKAEKAQRP